MSSQYQHFIPQFIIRKFSNIETLVAEGLKGKKARKYCKVQFLNLEDGKIESRNVSRTFGVNNMYLDPSIFLASTVAECTVEKKLGELEDRAAKILQEIEVANDRGDAGFSLPRHEKDELRRFLFILLYRNRTLERRFEKSRSDYDANDRYNMLIYMQERRIKDPKTVWLNNLLAFLTVELDPDSGWVKEITENVYLPDAMWFFMHLQSTFLSFCCPADLPGSNDEFMLTQNAYSIFEGPNGETDWMDWHVFAPISPNLMIVMRKTLLLDWGPIGEKFLSLEQLKRWKSMTGLDRNEPFSPSILADLPLQPPQVKYSRPPVDGEKAKFCKDDEFSFSFVRLATEHLQRLNVIFFEEAITTSGIVFRNHQKFKFSLENYLVSDPMQFKKTYSDKELLKDHIPLPPSLRTNAWKSANIEGYLKLLETAAADLGSDVKARYFDLNLFKHMDGVSAEFIRRYSILGMWDPVTLPYVVVHLA